jgi:hypothetical protein
MPDVQMPSLVFLAALFGNMSFLKGHSLNFILKSKKAKVRGPQHNVMFRMNGNVSLTIKPAWTV